MCSRHASRYLLVLALFVLALVAQATTTYPTLQFTPSIPSPEPTLPAQFDTFTPPVASITPATDAARNRRTTPAPPDRTTPSSSPAPT